MTKHMNIPLDAATLRLHAEQLWTENGSTLPQAMNEAHEQLKELQIHHIELELRNKSLQQSLVEAEAKLRELGTIEKSLRLTQFALDHLSMPVAMMRVEDGRFIYVNEAGCQSTGYSREELLEMTLFNVDPEFSPERWAELNQHLREGNVSPFETTHISKDGRMFTVEVTANVLEIEGVEYHIGFSNNITERKKAQEALEASLEFSNELIRSMQDGFSVLDKDGCVIDANPALCCMTCFSREELIGSSAPFPYWPPEEYESIQEAFQKTLNGEVGNFELTFMRKNGERFPVIVSPSFVKDKKNKIISYTATVKDISERKAAEDEIEHLAFYDPLTQLPNRRLLQDRLGHSLASCARSRRTGALLFIDLDNFKSLNDTLGHDIGDILLQQVAQRLESCVREGDTVARLGGDEFVVMLDGLYENELEAAAKAETVSVKILTTLSLPYHLSSYEYQTTASIGATLFSNHRSSIEELMKQADIAMYQAKQAGRNTLRFFDQQMQKSVAARVALEGELHKALENQQFQLYYQVQVDTSNRAIGAEALIRWLHPERGLVPPTQFISLTEETGLILTMGKWVLETACAQIKAWEQMPQLRDLVLAVNVSAKQFRQPGFVDQVQSIVREHAINPMLLKLELTEGTLLENIEDTVATMNALNEIGLQISLDDFGTGYSSLQYIKRLPLDQLKIDKTFIRDLATDSSDKAIVHTIIAMARNLDLDVIAEGVETEEQQQLLLDMGCSHYQGFFFGKPAQIEQFETLLR